MKTAFERIAWGILLGTIAGLTLGEIIRNW